MTARRSATAPRRQPDRMVVPDVLRGVAILAMLVAHGASSLLPEAPAVLKAVFGQLNALASPLFAVVMGIAAQLVLSRPGGSRAAVIVQQAARGAILIALGVWLATWGSWVDIVLAYLGVVAIVGALLLLLPTRALALVAAALLILGEPLNQVLRQVLLPLVVEHPWLWAPAQWIVFGSNYRLVNLLPMFLLGALVLRRGLPAGRALIGVGIVGLLLWAAGPVAQRALGWPQPGSGSTLDTARDLGLIALAYVVVAVLAQLRASTSRPVARRVVDAIFLPFRASGTVALSLYVLQVALIGWWARSGVGYQDNEYLRWLLLVPGLMVLAVLWWRFVGLGPIEWLIGAVTGRYRLRRPPRDRSPAGGSDLPREKDAVAPPVS